MDRQNGLAVWVGRAGRQGAPAGWGRVVGVPGMSWEQFILSDPDNRLQHGIVITTYAQYIASIRSLGTFIGVPELDVLAREKGKYIVVVTPSGVIRSSHGDPQLEPVVLRYANRHYELMRLASLPASTSTSQQCRQQHHKGCRRKQLERDAQPLALATGDAAHLSGRCIANFCVQV